MCYVPSYHPINNEFIPFQSCWYSLSSTRPQFPPIFQKTKSHEKLTCSFVLSTTSGRDMQWACLGLTSGPGRRRIQLERVEGDGVCVLVGRCGWGRGSRGGGTATMIHIWGQFWRVESGVPPKPLGTCILTLPHPLELEPCPVRRDPPRTRIQALQRVGSWLIGTQKLCCLPSNVIIDVLATGVPDHMDSKQLLSSAVRFSNVIYRGMLTVDFLPAIKVAWFTE